MIKTRINAPATTARANKSPARRRSFLLLLLLLPIPAHAATESTYDRVMRTNTLRCGFLPWPPFWTVDVKTGEVGGMAHEMALALGQLLDLKMEFVQRGVAGAQVEDFRRGAYDAVCDDSPYTFSTIKYVDYTTPIYYTQVLAYVNADNPATSLVELNRPTVTFLGIDGDLSVQMVQRRFPDAKLRTVPASTDISLVLLDVAAGKANAVIVDPSTALNFNAANPPGLKAASLQPVAVYPTGLSLNKGEDKLLNMLNAGINALNNTGAVQPILERYDPMGKFYFPVAVPYQTRP